MGMAQSITVLLVRWDSGRRGAVPFFLNGDNMKNDIKVDIDTLKKIPDTRLEITIKHLAGELDKISFTLGAVESGKQTLSESEMTRLQKNGKLLSQRILAIKDELDRRALEVISHAFK